MPGGDRAAASVRLEGRWLYLCTPDRPDLTGFLASCIEGGVDVVQLRDKNLEARPLLRRAELAMAVCRDMGVPFILNDRPDLALEVGADGVHVGQEDAPAGLARRVLGPGALVGLSTHSPQEMKASGGEPVDYISAGVQPRPMRVELARPAGRHCEERANWGEQKGMARTAWRPRARCQRARRQRAWRPVDMAPS